MGGEEILLPNWRGVKVKRSTRNQGVAGTHWRCKGNLHAAAKEERNGKNWGIEAGKSFHRKLYLNLVLRRGGILIAEATGRREK